MKSRILASACAAVLLSGCALTPQPLSDEAVNRFTEANLADVVAGQEPITGPIGLYEAMARALKYNLDFRVEMMNKALARAKVDVKSYDMLPKAVASAGYAGRSNFSGGKSRSLITGIESLEPSTSAEKEIVTADMTFSWNILDFGLSYIRAKQAADEALIAEERKRKVVNRIIEDVRTAYWRALSAQRLVGALSRLKRRVARALVNSRQLSTSGQAAPLTALTYERELVEIKRQIQDLQRDLRTAKMQLAALMNVPPGVKFTLRATRHNGRKPLIRMKSAQLIALALRNRPELREAAYKQRINAKEADAALVELLPGAQIYAAANFDSNDFLFHSNWLSWGAKASWNLMRVFTYPARRKLIEARDELNHQQALALTMAVMTQVHVARARYHFLRRSLHTAREYLNVQHRILRQVRAAAASDATSEQSLIREEMNTLVARARYDIAYANVQNAYAGVFASVGVDPYGDEVSTTMNVKQLAGALRKVWSSRGDWAGS